MSTFDEYLSRVGFQPLTTAERDSISPFDGQIIFNLDRGRNETYDGAVWLNELLIRAVNDSGGALAVGAPVIPSGVSDSGVTTTTNPNDPDILGAVVDGTLTAGGTLTVAVSGSWPVLASGAVARGDLLASSAVAGEAAAGTPQGSFAIARGTLAGPGPALVDATIQPTARTDASPAFSPRSVAAITLTGANGQPYIESTAQTYDIVAQYGWAGSDVVSTVESIGAIVELGGGTSMNIRVFDATNVATIAELTGITDPTFTFRDLGAITNVTTTPAIWEIQLRATGGGRKARCASVVFLPPTS
jgi:hypothetical protein